MNRGSFRVKSPLDLYGGYDYFRSFQKAQERARIWADLYQVRIAIEVKKRNHPGGDGVKSNVWSVEPFLYGPTPLVKIPKRQS